MANIERKNLAASRSLLAGDDVLADLLRWTSEGRKAALVTLVTIDGATPRPLGAQMAVCEDGSYAGYLSGGCLEQAVADEALSVLREGKNRLFRFGKGSAYFDLKLPCGSGLDLYFDQGLTREVLKRVAELRKARTALWIDTDLEIGSSQVVEAAPEVTPRSEKLASTFRRAVLPLPRMLLAGGGPAFVAIAQLLAATGFEIDVLSPDDNARRAIEGLGVATRGLTDASAVDVAGLDRWSAAVVAFHDHDWEAPVLAAILKTDCFFIGVMGSKAAHDNRLGRLAGMGVCRSNLQRLRSPVGLIPGAKSRLTLAAGVVAEVVAQAKAAGLLD